MRGICSGDIDSRRRTRLDDAFHQQQIVGANHGVAGNRQLLRQPPRRRQPRPRPDPRAADRFANLIDHLRRQRLRPRPVKENGNLHVSCLGSARSPGRSKGWASYGSSRPNFDAISADVSRFVGRFGLVPSDLPATGLITAAMPGGCPAPMQVLPETLHAPSNCWASQPMPRPVATSADGAIAFYRGGSHCRPAASCERGRTDRPSGEPRRDAPGHRTQRRTHEHRTTTLAVRRGRRSRHPRIRREPPRGPKTPSRSAYCIRCPARWRSAKPS